MKKLPLAIEPMQAAHVDAVIRVQRQSFSEHLRETPEVIADRFNRFGRHFLVALDADGTIAGYALSFPWQLGLCPANNCPFPAELPVPDSFYLHDITVLERCRGTGTAAAMLQRIYAMGRAEGFRRVSLVSVQQAGNYWDRQGFVSLPGLDTARLEYIRDNYGEGARLMFKVI